MESIRWILSCSNAAIFVLRVEAVWLGAPPGVELNFTWPPGNTGCCWHRTFFGSAYQLRFSRVTTGGAAIYCNSFPQWNTPELSIFAAFGNFCRWKVTVVQVSGLTLQDCVQTCKPDLQLPMATQEPWLKEDLVLPFLTLWSSILTWMRGQLRSLRQFPQGETAPLHWGVGWPLRFPQMWETRHHNFC